jgi:GTP-binding protein
VKFLDQAKIFIKSGDGGAGCVSFRREKHIEFGGPNGGNGGKGGDIIVKAADNLNTLIDYRYQQHFKAPKGGHGMGKSRNGKDGVTLILRVPTGTQIWDDSREVLLADMIEPGQELTLLTGGRGGMGNEHFKSSTNRAPRYAQPGEAGHEEWIWLHLKLIADVGLVGLPNAGKSTFLSVVSHAKPKIADYPFTTLNPQLGVVRMGDDREFVLADLPGLIEGASDGRGLGDRFLGHAERCRVIIHVIDGTQESPLEAYETIRHEVEAYGHSLSQKPEVIMLNKVDALSEEDTNALITALQDLSGVEVFPVSAVAQQGLKPLLEHVWQLQGPTSPEGSPLDVL